MKLRPTLILLAALLATAAFATRSAHAGVTSVPDGSGGFFVAWDEFRNESDVASTSEILVQRYTVLGTPAPGWPAYGLHVTDSPPNQDSPSMVSDGAGGVIVVWLDHTGGGLMPRAQHLSAAGQHLWASVGMALSEGDSLRTAPIAVSDGAGGAFVTWSDYLHLSPNAPGIVVQHLASDGSISSGWPLAGLLIKQDAAIVGSPELFGDGAGGAIVVWQETAQEWFAQRLTAAGVRLWSPPTGRDLGVSGSWTFVGDNAGGLLAALIDASPSFEWEVVAQRFDGGGAQAWVPTGVVVRTSPNQMSNARVAEDGSGGLIVAWADDPAGGSFAQRLDATGAVAPGWPTDGAQITDAGRANVIAPDGTGGAFFAWMKFSGVGSFFDVVSQHLANDGTRPAGWPLSGALVASGTTPNSTIGNAAISDGTGGEFVIWGDARSGLLGHDLFAQRLDVAGARQWGDGGFAISSEAQCQRAPAVVGDGAGGAVGFWMDKRSGGWDIYGKRVNAAGLPLGASAAISAAVDDQTNVQAVDDGAGGGCAAWLDFRNGVQGVEAQRLTSGGSPAWTPDGVDLVEGYGSLVPFGLASDGAGGAIVTWPQRWSSEVFAQRLDGGGAPLWGTGGVSVVAYTSTINENWIDAVSDGAGGAIVVWWGNGFDPDSAKYAFGYHAQRLSAAGSRLWGNDGVVLARAAANGIRQRVTGDGAGSVYIAWQEDELLDGSGVIRVQHRDALGHLAAGWPEHGIVVASLATRKRLAAISPDGAGGVVVGWGDLGSGTQWASRVQRVATDATVKWSAEGVLLSTNAGDQLLSGIVPDGSGGAIALWMDGAGTTWDIRAQRVNDVGVTQWSTAGLDVCTAAGNQYAPAVVSDGAGGALVAWQDDREFPIDQVFMARIGAGGALLWPSDGVVPVMASVVSAEVRNGVAHLEWQVASATHAQIERSDDGVAWSNRATLDADGQGRIRFDDADVRPARRYGWRLAIPTTGGVARVGEAWLDISVRVSFALRGTYPNPSNHDVSIAFSLPVGAPARLEVIDVSGRRVWSREVGTLGAGPHDVSLPALRAGVYLARLTQGSRSATARFERVK